MKNAKGEPLLYSENDLKNKIQSQLQALKEEVAGRLKHFRERRSDLSETDPTWEYISGKIYELDKIMQLITNLEDK